MTIAHWLNRKWKYADSKETSEPGYLARRFERIRREQRAAEAQQQAADLEAQAKTVPMRKIAK